MKRKVGEERDRERTADFSERVAVEEEERGAAMAGSEEPERFEQGQFGDSFLFPLCCDRCVSFRVNASLRAASFAESSIDLGDRCPVPVFEKLGSAL